MCLIFGPMVTSPLDFKARVGSNLFACFWGGKCNVHSPRSTSGATPTDLLTPSIAASHFPICILCEKSFYAKKICCNNKYP